MSKWLVILTETVKQTVTLKYDSYFRVTVCLKKPFCFPFPLPSHFFRFLKRSPQQREIIQTLEKLESK